MFEKQSLGKKIKAFEKKNDFMYHVEFHLIVEILQYDSSFKVSLWHKFKNTGLRAHLFYNCLFINSEIAILSFLTYFY